MKKKSINFLLPFIFTATVSYSYGNETLDTTGKSEQIQFILSGIKTSQSDKKTADVNVETAKNDIAVLSPALEQKMEDKKAEAKKIFDEHDNKHETGSSEFYYWQGLLSAAVSAATAFQDSLKLLQQNLD